MADSRTVKDEIFISLRTPSAFGSDSALIRSLSTSRCDDLPPSHVTEVLELAHQVYHQAVKSHINALDAERDRLRRAVHNQKQELARIPDKLWVARALEAEEQTDKIKGLMLQVRRLGEESRKLGERAEGG